MFRALRPLFVWLIGSLLLLGWVWYERAAAGTVLVFRVSVDGSASFPEDVSAAIDGQPFLPGERVGIGRSTLVLTGHNLEPFRTNFFVWFGRNDLRELKLSRMKGTLAVTCDPSPREIQIQGALVKKTTTDADTSILLPIGAYRVTAVFAHSQVQDEVFLRRNETNRLRIAPAFGSLAVSSDPPGARFTVASVRSTDLAVSGEAPATIDQLPVGRYQVSAQWRDSVNQLWLQIKAGDTNRQSIVFPYGTVRLKTTPPGAVISTDYRQIGQTPASFLFKPGEYLFHVALDGYRSADFSAFVEDKKTVVLSTNLVNSRYAEAMEAARNALMFRNYDQALGQVREALRFEPSDPEALSLQTKLAGALKERAAKAEAEGKAAEAQAAEEARRTEAARRRAAEKAELLAVRRRFEEIMSREKDAALFPTRMWTMTNRLVEVAQAMRRMLAEQDAPWKLVREETPAESTILFRCQGNGIIKAQEKRCVIMIVQTAPGQAFLCAKFFEYTMLHDLSSLLLSATSAAYVPVTPDRYRPGDPGAAEKHLKAVADDFAARLAKELQSKPL